MSDGYDVGHDVASREIYITDDGIVRCYDVTHDCDKEAPLIDIGYRRGYVKDLLEALMKHYEPKEVKKETIRLKLADDNGTVFADYSLVIDNKDERMITVDIPFYGTYNGRIPMTRVNVIIEITS